MPHWSLGSTFPWGRFHHPTPDQETSTILYIMAYHPTQSVLSLQFNQQNFVRGDAHLSWEMTCISNRYKFAIIIINI